MRLWLCEVQGSIGHGLACVRCCYFERRLTVVSPCEVVSVSV